MKKFIIFLSFLVGIVLIASVYIFFKPQDTTVALPEDNKYIEAIELGGEWFLNNQNEEFIYYQYNPFDKEHPDKHQSLREAGGLWSISRLAVFLNDPRYYELTNKGFKYFENTFEYDEENDFYYITITPEKLKLGYSAFAILTLLEIDHPKKEEYLEKLANGIIYLQNEDGELRTFFYSDRSTGKDYYPGEALVALMALYEYTNNPTYLETVQKAFPHYTEYWRNDKTTAFVPWQSRAYKKLYDVTKDSEVADFIFEMNDFMIEQHGPSESCDNYNFHRGSVTAVFMEGVNKAYDISVEIGDEKRAECYKNFIQEGADYMLSIQITKETIKDENLDIEALGGFLGNETSDSTRVDRNQHAVMALMEAYESGLLE